MVSRKVGLSSPTIVRKAASHWPALVLRLSSPLAASDAWGLEPGSDPFPLDGDEEYSVAMFGSCDGGRDQLSPRRLAPLYRGLQCQIGENINFQRFHLSAASLSSMIVAQKMKNTMNNQMGSVMLT